MASIGNVTGETLCSDTGKVLPQVRLPVMQASLFLEGALAQRRSRESARRRVEDSAELC